ncbi:Rpp14/Pop5 family protein [Halococcoides cellulosivorans]|uniref:Ribonuclease P protein component 2 n=1 Tax=Halococcoides cellulosivorans TaxID=1679096 RepID=A0A2R4X3B4_9EURY|nr:Rpp14/Pop5 family protein [Halococcoides cellulosivorans]AWB28277.1 ribonuclease P [Halococcoides cellulosivorans]
MKHLPKYLRPRWRYLAVGIESWPDADIDRRAFQGAIWGAARALFGDTASAAADLSVLDWEFADGTGEAIVRVRRGECDRARAAIASIDAVDDAPVGLVVRGISGTLRACEEKYMGRAPIAHTENEVVFGNDRRTAVTRDGRVDVRDGETFTGATDFDCR